MMAWHRGKAKIKRLFGIAPTKARAMRQETYRLPFEIVEMIIAHLTYDLDALKACSLTCRFWYAIAVLHIHHTLVLKGKIVDTARRRLKPLSKLHELGLIHLVKEIQVGQLTGPVGWFGPEAFSSNRLFQFSTFTNVHTLRIQGLNIDRFMPSIKCYFQQFLPTLRSISLYYPTCSAPRHLSYFLSLFPNLENIDIRQFLTRNIPVLSPELISYPAPRFRGQLTLHNFLSTEAWTCLIDVCGGIRFRHMVLRKVGACAPIVLAACTETLETLRFYLMEEPGQ